MLDCRGKSCEQNSAIIGDAVKQVVALARDRGKPQVMERLDFKRMKAEQEGAQVSRCLSALGPMPALGQTLQAASQGAGVEMVQVNPAYTLVIGAVNFAQQRAFRFIRARQQPSPLQLLPF